jgi:hypothetical protein
MVLDICKKFFGADNEHEYKLLRKLMASRRSRITCGTKV